MNCPMCDESSDTVQERWINTRYVDEDRNRSESCRTCFERIWTEFDDLWTNVPGGSPFDHTPPPDPEVVYGGPEVVYGGPI